MDRVKCYTNTIGELFDQCVRDVMEEVKRQKRMDASIILQVDGIPLRITKRSTYKSIKYDYMINGSKR